MKFFVCAQFLPSKFWLLKALNCVNLHCAGSVSYLVSLRRNFFQKIGIGKELFEKIETAQIFKLLGSTAQTNFYILFVESSYKSHSLYLRRN